MILHSATVPAGKIQAFFERVTLQSKIKIEEICQQQQQKKW